jgi:hypothetical protein
MTVSQEGTSKHVATNAVALKLTNDQNEQVQQKVHPAISAACAYHEQHALQQLLLQAKISYAKH